MTKTSQENKTISYFISTHTNKFKDSEPNPDKPGFGGYDIIIDDQNLILPVNFIVKYKVRKVTKYCNIPKQRDPLRECAIDSEGNQIFHEDDLYDEIWGENIIVTVNVFSYYQSEKEALNLSRELMKKFFSYSENTETLNKSAKFEFVSIQVA
jgi:hypothetical protein